MSSPAVSCRAAVTPMVFIRQSRQKEHVKVRRESKTLATITFQNFFNKYEKKGGMTGTAQTEEQEFRNIYGMDVIVIPTNRPVIRVDMDDAVYMTKKEKFHAVVEEVQRGTCREPAGSGWYHHHRDFRASERYA